MRFNLIIHNSIFGVPLYPATVSVWSGWDFWDAANVLSCVCAGVLRCYVPSVIKWARGSQEMRREGRRGGREVEDGDGAWMETRMCMNEAGERGVVGGKWWMSRAWPLFQVNLWGVFDHAGDLKWSPGNREKEQGFKQRRGTETLTWVAAVGGWEMEHKRRGKMVYGRVWKEKEQCGGNILYGQKYVDTFFQG